MSYRITQTPLGWHLYVAGEQAGDPHPTFVKAVVAAFDVMKIRGDGKQGGTWRKDWDDSFRWIPGPPARWAGLAGDG
jgi:hypothetical protein